MFRRGADPADSGSRRKHALLHEPSGKQVATVEMLTGWWAKGIGVIGMRALSRGTGVVMPGVASIHTLFVRFPLDILFLDHSRRLMKACPRVQPWTPLVQCPGSWYTVELGAGTLDDQAMLDQGAQWRIDAL